MKCVVVAVCCVVLASCGVARVVDRAGGGLADVRVVISNKFFGQWMLHTDSQGWFGVPFFASKNAGVSFTKEGYKVAARTVEEIYEQNMIVLVPVDYIGGNPGVYYRGAGTVDKD